MKSGHVYALVNPLTSDIFYVGYTSRTLKHRLKSHLSSGRTKSNSSLVAAYIKMLLDLSATPEITLLETVVTDANSKESVIDAESKWIRRLASNGINLCQTNKFPSEYIDPMVEVFGMIRVSESFLEKVKVKYSWGDYEKIANKVNKSNEMARICMKGLVNPMKVEMFKAIKKYYNINNKK